MHPPPEARLSEGASDYCEDKERYQPSRVSDLAQPYQHLEQKALLQLTPTTLKAIKKYFIISK